MLGKILAILIAILAVLFVGWVIIKSMIDRKHGKNCCGDCSSCSACKYKTTDNGTANKIDEK